jgi:16S rRNA processing protein RimM
LNEENWVAVGRLIRVRGNRGELMGEIYSSQPGRAEKLHDVTLERNGQRRAAEVEQFWYHGDRPIFKFAGIDSISQAEEWAGADILVPEIQKAGPGDGEYSHADLIGCKLLGLNGPPEIGTVKGLEDCGGPVLLKVETQDGREILIPFAQAICREIDIAAKTIRVELPEGLLEL